MKKSLNTHEEINAVEVNDVLFELLKASYPVCEYKIEDGKPIEFENLINVTGNPDCEPKLNKLENELKKFKDKKNDELTYKEDLKTKKETAKTLFLATREYFHQAIGKTPIPHIPNPEAWLRDNCERVNTQEEVDSFISKLQQINDKVTEVLSEIEEENQKIAENNVTKQAIKNFDINTIDDMGTAQLKNLIKNIVKVIKYGVK